MNDTIKISKLLKRIISVCDFSKEYENKDTILTSNPQAVIVTATLSEINSTVCDLLNLEKYKFSESRGSGSFPKVPWAGISTLGKKVSNSISVVTCFARGGTGIVCGLMCPAEISVRIPTVFRSNQPNFLNVDGVSSSTKYNDKFINPIEFPISNIQPKIYLKHIQDSLELLEKIKIANELR
jgi:hypothetical protein